MNRAQERASFLILKQLESNPELTQRELAQALGISLGGVNYCLKALVGKGCIKMQNFQNSQAKQTYAYLLTPQGVAEKMTLTVHFLEQKLQEYEALQREIATLQQDVECWSQAGLRAGV